MPFWPKSHSFGFTTSLSWFFSHPPTPFGLCYKLGKFGLCTAATLTCHIRIPCNNRDCKYDITAMLHYQCYKCGKFRIRIAATPTCHIQVPRNNLDCQYDITAMLYCQRPFSTLVNSGYAQRQPVTCHIQVPCNNWTANMTLLQCYIVSILPFRYQTLDITLQQCYVFSILSFPYQTLDCQFNITAMLCCQHPFFPLSK